MLEWSYYVLLLIVLIAGWLANILGLPGLWLMLLGHIIYTWATGWDHYTGWTAISVLFVLAVAAEVIEFVAGAAGSKSAGGTKRGMMGAIVGGLAGGIVGSIVIPIPIAGTIVGAVAGSFAGAAVIEKMIHPDNGRAFRIGVGAAKGRLAGIIIKSGVGFVMAAVSLVAAVPLGPPPPIIPASQPTSLPASLLPATQP
jgi:hypothetical protein